MLVLLVGYNIYSGITAKRIAIPGMFEVEFAGQTKDPGSRDATSGGLGQGSNTDGFKGRQDELEEKIRLLEEQLHQRNPEPRQPESVSIAGTWQGQQGISYQFQQYGSQIIFTETNPYFGITASGQGSMNGLELQLSVLTAAFTVGTATLRLSSNNRQLSGTYYDQSTGMSTRLLLTR